MSISCQTFFILAVKIDHLKFTKRNSNALAYKPKVKMFVIKEKSLFG
jgi:hypothetical protein